MATAKEPAPVVRVLGRDRASARPIFSVALGGDDQAEITANWDRLVEDGIVSVPLARSVWGATFGSCTTDTAPRGSSPCLRPQPLDLASSIRVLRRSGLASGPRRGAAWHRPVVPTGGVASVRRRWAVFARSTSINAQPSMIDQGIAHVRDTVMPALSHLDGYLGLSLMVDRETGRGIVTSGWRSEDAMRDSTERALVIRDAAVRAFGASGADVRAGRWSSCTGPITHV